MVGPECPVLHSHVAAPAPVYLQNRSAPLPRASDQPLPSRSCRGRGSRIDASGHPTRSSETAARSTPLSDTRKIGGDGTVADHRQVHTNRSIAPNVPHRACEVRDNAASVASEMRQATVSVGSRGEGVGAFVPLKAVTHSTANGTTSLMGRDMAMTPSAMTVHIYVRCRVARHAQELHNQVLEQFATT